MKKTTKIIGGLKSDKNKIFYQRITRGIRNNAESGKSFFSRVWQKLNLKRVPQFLRKRPTTSFIISLLILFLLIAASNFLLKPKVTSVNETQTPKKVDIYKIGEAPKINLQGQVEKSGVVTVNAQVSGVVQNIYVQEGDNVKKGDSLVLLSTNYQGGNALAVSRQIAQQQFNNINDTFNTQKDLINKQIDLANQTDINNDQLRQIGANSLGVTNSIIDLNQSIIRTLDSQITQLEATNSAGINDNALIGPRAEKSQFEIANNQLRTTVNNLNYTTPDTNAPALMSDLQRQITLEQLDVQEKGLELSKEVARLSLSLAFINEALMYPAAPFDGVVDRIHIKVGQLVNPGTPLVSFSGTTQHVTVVVRVPDHLAKTLSRLETSTLHLGDKTLELHPDYISSNATDGELYSVIFNLPDGYEADVTDGGYISVDLPVGYPDTSAAIPFVPLDAVFQSQTEAYLYVVKKDSAESHKVELGDVVGRFVQVKSGLTSGDQVILNRNVIAGDKVEPNE
ncbi:HlyD family efflux transporter periplasmic adaptor subunit [Candidatus Daviesbacteria bacterium]|nr:HlyD family efflux transporter periplasmic adaptor subunit [Candidatus Daviesbacteria bacterium]